MKIEDVKQNSFFPFEIENNKLIRLFSFYLHSAPTIESRTAAHIDEQRLLNNWLDFSSKLTRNMMKFYSESYPVERFRNSFGKYGVNDDAVVNRRTKAIVCKKKNKVETDYCCLLRHLRNSIAHNNVYIADAGNRKYILFEDLNQKGNITAKILLSQTDLTRLKKEIMK